MCLACEGTKGSKKAFTRSFRTTMDREEHYLILNTVLNMLEGDNRPRDVERRVPTDRELRDSRGEGVGFHHLCDSQITVARKSEKVTLFKGRTCMRFSSSPLMMVFAKWQMISPNSTT